MKVLLKYIDWLLLERGEIRPEIGDKIVATSKGMINRVVNDVVNCSPYYDCKDSTHEINFRLKCGGNKNPILYSVNQCYVEIEYNPNEAIEFAEYCGKFGDYYEHTWYEGVYTTKELYQQFKKYKNE